MIRLVRFGYLLYPELCSAEILRVADTEEGNDGIAQVVKQMSYG